MLSSPASLYMSIKIALSHYTTYEYDREVQIYPQIIRLRPAPHCRTPIVSYSLKVEPEEHFLNWQQDPFGNYLARLVFPEKSDHLKVKVDLVADMIAINPFDFFLEEAFEEYPFEYRESEKAELGPYLKRTDMAEGIDHIAMEFEGKEKIRTIDFLVAVNQRINERVDYKVRLEPGVQTCDETLYLDSGSCRDSAFLLMQVFRRLGLAARFVSGYLIQLTEDEKPIEGPAGPTEDFTDLHAWTEVYLPGAGWVGLDPTSGLFASEGHIPLACTPEPSSAAPIDGAIGDCETKFTFKNEIRRFHEDPRVTKPYTSEVWRSIDAVGKLVDKRLDANEVRLTMGGEPTFVSIDDMEGPEWNTTADSPFKRERSIDLTKRLRDSFAPGGMIWYGEGKWYPGELIPRWAYGIFWRKDGTPLWNSEEAEGDPSKPGEYGFEEPRVLMEEFATILGYPKSVVMPAYEDAEYYRWKSSGIPIEESIEIASDDANLERRTLAELVKRGIESPAGYVVPVFVHKYSGRWAASAWEFRRKKLFLIPGASSLGFRLPLDSIREATEEDIIEVRSPMEEDVPPFDENPLEKYENNTPADDYGWIPRTAISVENREGRIHVFMPPTPTLEHYLDLLAIVEKAALNTGLKVVIEGYEPPKDARMESLKVTPDPGVIEVNIHPSHSWTELVERTETLYEDAKQARLGTEKFMLDGRHSGTGGGNHVVIGGATPADSPFLRRPDLLASMVTYWQHHPGLSYLFSGLFIGPTSQSPRADETRDGRVFEMEIALDGLFKGVDQPIMIDRIMRHLLTDLTGNTHRAEICIDKLFSPDSSTGQLGLVELRGFEMPPHRQMALVQSLLVRALILRFWEKPYHQKLVRWGSKLHDKYLLPYFVWEDIREVCLDLKECGIPYLSEWLEPFFEFRFPKLGEARRAGVDIELRTALEPWNVLGEESTSQGTSRFVDSSMERIQVSLKGIVEGRHILSCNGRRVPLYPTANKEEWVAGVRFKAWNPPSSMHPMIDAQSPLIFDVIDTWNRKSLGGIVYHVSHPGGLSYESFPVNSREAEARRRSRFWTEGYTSGTIETAAVSVDGNVVEFLTHEGEKDIVVIPPLLNDHEFSHTLDLRKT
ncbi:MAG: transglutaminase family protein [Verrucomicrobiales bacterium]|nr:transglutaminase family protein [Verrucomicrobiales bacterium]